MGLPRESRHQTHAHDKEFASFQSLMVCEQLTENGVREFSVQRAQCKLMYNRISDLFVAAHFRSKHPILFPGGGE
jgi:hypothetical protein